MKNLTRSITFFLMWTLICSYTHAQNSTVQDSSFVGIIFDSTIVPPISLFDVPIKNMKLYGTEKQINELLGNPFVVNCNSLMDPKTCKDFKKITNKSLVKSNSLRAELDNPNDFIKVLKKELDKKANPKSKLKEEKGIDGKTDKCEVVGNICIGNKEASFSIGCENGFSIEVSTAGTVKLTTERNGVSAGVTLIK